MRKRILALILSLCMVTAFVPAVAYAGDWTVENKTDAYDATAGNEAVTYDEAAGNEAATYEEVVENEIVSDETALEYTEEDSEAVSAESAVEDAAAEGAETGPDDSEVRAEAGDTEATAETKAADAKAEAVGADVPEVEDAEIVAASEEAVVEIEGETHSHEGYDEISTESQLRNLLATGGSGVLTADITIAQSQSMTLTVGNDSGEITVNLCLNGHTIDLNGDSEEENPPESHIVVSYNATLNIYDCGEGCITNGYACDGGAFYVENETSKLNLYNVNVKKCYADSCGGAICCQNGTVHMYGGTLTENTAKCGGAVYNVAANSFHMHGGTINGNRCVLGSGQKAGRGGGVYNGGNMSLDGTCVIKDNYIAKINEKGNLENIAKSNVYVFVPSAGDKEPLIDLNYLDGKGLTDGSEVGITLYIMSNSNYANQFTKETAKTVLNQENQKGYFFSDSDAFKVVYVEEEGKGHLELQHYHDNCNFTREISSENELRDLFEYGGSGVLTADIKIAQEDNMTLTVGNDSDEITVNLCLNGHTINLNGDADHTSHIEVSDNATLNIYDCGGGCITNGYANYGGAVKLNDYYSELNLYGVTIKNCWADSSGGAVYATDGIFYMDGGIIRDCHGEYAGGAVYVDLNGEFSFNNGKITGCSAGDTEYSDDSTVLGKGGAVYVNGGTFYMNGGTITGNTTLCFGAVYNNQADKSVHINNGSIVNNTGGGIYNNNGVLTLEGKCVIDGNKIKVGQQEFNYNVVIATQMIEPTSDNSGEEIFSPAGFTSRKLIEFEGNGLTDGSRVGVTLPDSSYTYSTGTFTKNTSVETLNQEGQKDYFFSDCDAFKVVYEDEEGEGHLELACNHEHNECAFDTAITSEYDLMTLFQNGGSGVLTNDITISSDSSLTAYSETTVNLCLNGYTIDLNGGANNESHIVVYSDATLNIYDCGEGCITNGYATRGGAFEVNGTLNLYSGVISNCTAGYGGAVDCRNGSFNMYGGELTGNKAIILSEYSESGVGGAVYNGKSAESFHMHGGTITGNTAENVGGGVYNIEEYKDLEDEIKACSFEGLCIVKDNYSYHGAEIKDENKVRDNVCTFEALLIGKPSGKTSLSEGSEIGVTLMDETGKVSKGYFSANGSATDATYFKSDIDAYCVKSDDKNGLYLCSRITEHPTSENGHLVEVDTEGLGYTDVKYQWMKSEFTELKDANKITPYGMVNSNTITAEYAEMVNTESQSISYFVEAGTVDGNTITAEKSSEDSNYYIMLGTGDADSVAFNSTADDLSIKSPYIELDNKLIKEDDTYIYTEKSLGYLMVVLKSTKEFTIENVRFINKTEETFADTDNQLNGATVGNPYFCTITYKDGSTDSSDHTIFTHEHSWGYELSKTKTDNDTVTATCKGAGTCKYEGTDKSLTIQAPVSLVYDGKSHDATFVTTSFLGGALPTISYQYKQNADGTYAPATDTKKAGFYRASFTVGEGDGARTAYVEYEVTKKQLVISSETGKTTTAADKVYDGTTVASATIGTVEGVVESDKVTVEITSADFSDKNAGDSKTVTVVYGTTGDDAGNYIKPVDGSVSAKITAKTVSVTADNKTTYVGSDLATLTYIAGDLIAGDSWTGALSTNADKDVVKSYDILQGSLTVSDGNNGNNYTINYTKGTYTVTAKEIQTLAFAGVTVGKVTKTYGDGSFTETVSGAKTGVTYSSSDETVAAVDAKTGKVTILKAGTAVIKAVAAESDVYAEGSAKYVLTVNKLRVDVPQAATGLVYNGKEQTGVVLPENALYTLTDNVKKDAGSYTAVASLKDKNNYEWNLETPSSADQSISWSIGRAKASVTAENKEMLLGDKVPEFTAKVTGLIGTDTVKYSFNTLNPDSQGMYSIVPAGDAVQGNYDVTYVQGVLAVSKKESNAKADTEDVAKVLEKYQAKEEYKDKTLDVEVRTDEKVPEANKEMINKQVASGKKVQFTETNLILIVKEDGSRSEKNIGDENDMLVSVTYKFDFTGKKDIQVLRVHEKSDGSATVDELTEKANADGEYVSINREAGTITVTAKKYSTFAVAYNETTVPATGDSNHAWLYIIIAALALGAMGTAVARRKAER